LVLPIAPVKCIIVTMTSWQPSLSPDNGPRYRAIADALEADLAGGRLRPGDRLPTHRDLAWKLGVTVGTMLMDEALHFMRLGTFLERGDNTARLLDVKFHAVESDFFGLGSDQDQEYDFYHWSAILRSVSGFEIYRKVYRDVIRPERVAELLVLRPDMPRSLMACMNDVVSNLSMVCGSETCRSCRAAGKLRSDIQFASIEEILSNGLHAFLTQFLDRINVIGMEISKEFLVPS